MKDIENEVLTPGKKTKTRSSRGKSFGYQILGFGSGAVDGVGAVSAAGVDVFVYG